MANQVPVTQQFDAFELESRGLREFVKIEFLGDSDATMYLTAHDQIEWLGRTWEFLPCKISESAQNSTGEMSRPKFTIVNPGGVFSVFIERGETDGALVTRYRALLSDIESGVSAYQKHMWIISRCINLNKYMAVFELRSTMDGAHFTLPARSFYPPEYPTVSLR